MSAKIVIITGANSGIGKAASTKFALLGYHVIMACRNPTRGERALEEVIALAPKANVELMIVDLSSQESIRQFVQEFKSSYDRLDVLINNAAKFDIIEKKAKLTKEGYESVWATNHLGPFLLTYLLIDILKQSASATVINIASQGLLTYPLLQLNFEGIERGFPMKKGNTKDKFSVQWAYYHSKLAQIMFTYELAERLKDTNITANIIQVGNVRFSKERLVELGVPEILQKIYYLKSKFAMTPEKMAETYVYCAENPEMKNLTGKYISHKNKKVRSNRFSYNKEAQKRLWDISELQTKTKRKTDNLRILQE